MWYEDDSPHLVLVVSDFPGGTSETNIPVEQARPVKTCQNSYMAAKLIWTRPSVTFIRNDMTRVVATDWVTGRFP